MQSFLGVSYPELCGVSPPGFSGVRCTRFYYPELSGVVWSCLEFSGVISSKVFQGFSRPEFYFFVSGMRYGSQT